MRDQLKTSLRTGVAVLTVTGLTMTGIAVAQTTDDSAPADDGSTESPDGFRFGPRHHRGAGAVATVAELTGLTVQEVIDQVADETTSLADVAAANGSSGDAIVAAMLDQLQSRLDQAVADERITQEDADEKLADAEQRITEHVNDDDFTPKERHGFRRGVDAAALAEVLGVTTDDLSKAKQDGLSLSDLAEQQGVPVDDVVAVLMAPLTERLEQAVADERITREDADEKLADAEQRITERVESDAPLGGPGRGFGPRRGFGPGGPGAGFGPAAEAGVDA